MVDFVEVFASFILGIFSGVIIHHFQFKYSLKIEKIKRLAPHLEAISPIIEKLVQDSEYAKMIQMRDEEDEFNRVLENIAVSLEEYGIWYHRFTTSGMIPELESIDSELLARLNGVYAFVRLNKLHGVQYLSQNVKVFAEHCGKCNIKLKSRLSS